MPKINFKSTVFHSITGEPEFCQIHDSDWWLNINNNTSFHFRLFPGKNPKNPILGVLFGNFCPNLKKINFSGKRARSVSKF